MIIKANRHSDGAKLADYLMNGGRHGERVDAPVLTGFASDNILDAFRDVEVMAQGTKAENPFLHVQIRLPDGEQITREQWERTADRTQRRLGLDGQPRADVYHIDEKTGEQHLHLVFSLIDAEAMKAKPLPFFKLRMKTLARELEEEFNITRVRNEREGPIKYAAKKNEQQQAQRLGVDKDAIRNTIRACWDASDGGRSFDDALAEAGLILAQGDRRDYLVIDHAGGLHALGKRLLDVSAGQVRKKLADLDRANMPTIQQAREFMLELPRDRVDRLTRELAEVQKQIEAEQEYARRDPVREEMEWLDAVAQAAIEKEKREGQFVERTPAPAGPAREEEARGGQQEKEKVPYAETLIQEAKDAAQLDIDKSADLGAAVLPSDCLAEAFAKKGLAFAVVTPEESYRSRREKAFAEAIERKSDYFAPGEIVLVTEPRLERLRAGEWTEPPRVHKLDQPQAEKYLDMLTLDRSKLKGIEATKATLDASAEKRAAYWRDIREERATNIWDRAPERDKGERLPAAIRKAPARAIGSAFNIGTELSGLFFSAIDAPKPAKQQERENREGERATAERNAKGEFQIDVSTYTAERTQRQRNEQEQQAVRDRERENERER